MKQLELYYKINSSVGIHNHLPDSYILLNTLIKHVVITSFTTYFIRWHVFDLKFDVKKYFFIFKIIILNAHFLNLNVSKPETKFVTLNIYSNIKDGNIHK